MTAEIPDDSHTVHRLVLAICQSTQPGGLIALYEAGAIRQTLSPLHLVDPGILKMLGDIELNLFNVTTGFDRLNRSRQAHEKLHRISPSAQRELRWHQELRSNSFKKLAQALKLPCKINNTPSIKSYLPK